MFNNIGFKIKMLARILTALGMVLSGIFGLITMFGSAAAGFSIIVVGCLGSWVGSFLLYGFGELIENVTEINEKLKKQ